MEAQSKEPGIVVSAAALTKSYRAGRRNRQVALAEFDLTCTAGSVTVLVGPNGAGKSTALRLITGIEAPDRGRLSVLGNSPAHASVRRHIGYLPDTSDLFEFLDVAETLAFFAAARGLDRKTAASRAGEVVDLLDLASYGKKRVRTFSMGMRRRLGLACVLIGRPELLVLDEPTAGLDPGGMRLFRELLRRERARGAAIVMASHHLGGIESFCDRVVALSRGRVRHAGDVPSLAAEVGAVDVTLADLTPEDRERLRIEVERAGGRWLSERVAAEALERRLLDDDA